MKHDIRPEDEFGRWTVINVVDPVLKKSKQRWLCRCECGTVKTVAYSGLVSGTSQSCGCLRNEQLALRRPLAKHGHSSKDNYSAEYAAWQNMKYRAKVWLKDNVYSLAIEPGWENSFGNFIRDVGHKPEPKLTLVRFDSRKGYISGNVGWL